MPIAEQDDVPVAKPKKKKKSVRTYVQKQPRAYVEQPVVTNSMNPYSKHYNPQSMMTPQMKPYARMNNANRQQMSLAYKQIDNMAKQATYAF